MYGVIASTLLVLTILAAVAGTAALTALLLPTAARGRLRLPSRKRCALVLAGTIVVATALPVFMSMASDADLQRRDPAAYEVRIAERAAERAEAIQQPSGVPWVDFAMPNIDPLSSPTLFMVGLGRSLIALALLAVIVAVFIPDARRNHLPARHWCVAATAPALLLAWMGMAWLQELEDAYLRDNEPQVFATVLALREREAQERKQRAKDELREAREREQAREQARELERKREERERKRREREEMVRELEEKQREQRIRENTAILEAAKRASKFPESTAETACRQAIRQTAKFPTKADFDFWSVNTFVRGGSVTVKGRVELMNGLGNMIPHIFECVVQNGSVKTLRVSPG